MSLVYLAGPISGQTYDEATDWRVEVSQQLGEYGIGTRSPMRGKLSLKNETVIEGGYPDHIFAGASAIITRDRFDVRTCDAILMNFLPAGSRVTIGTFIEMGWADAWRKPIIAVRRPDCQSYHPMVDQLIGFDLTSLDDAVQTLKVILA